MLEILLVSLALVSFYNVFYKFCWVMKKQFRWQYVIYDRLFQGLLHCRLSRYGSLYLAPSAVYVSLYDEGTRIHWTTHFSTLYFLQRFIYYYTWIHCSYLHTLQKKASNLIIDGCEPPCGCWDLNSGTLEEQSVLLTTEPSLQPQILGSVPFEGCGLWG